MIKAKKFSTWDIIKVYKALDEYKSTVTNDERGPVYAAYDAFLSEKWVKNKDVQSVCDRLISDLGKYADDVGFIPMTYVKTMLSRRMML
jgi:hypothetical protein